MLSRHNIKGKGPSNNQQVFVSPFNSNHDDDDDDDDDEKNC